MAQIAQQDNLVIDFGTITSFEDVSDDAKKQLRRAYLRGTIHDVIVKAKEDGGTEMTSKVIATYKNENEIYVTIRETLQTDETIIVDCGAIQPEDYSDDVPYEGE